MQFGLLFRPKRPISPSPMTTKPASRFLIDLVDNQINLARVQVATSRRAYSLNRFDDGYAALLKAEESYAQAARLAGELPRGHRELAWSALEDLSNDIDQILVSHVEMRKAQESSIQSQTA